MPRAKKTSATPMTAPRRTCGCMQVHYTLLERHPEFRRRQIEIEHNVVTRLRSAPALRTKPYKIQVVVQVLYKSTAEKLSQAQVKSQIAVLNRDFRGKNTDRNKVPPVWKGLVADSNIEFVLASKDPRGKASNGIVYTKTSHAEFMDDDSVKFTKRGGANAWPTDKYLNIWVCTLGGGLLGYAQFPGGPPKTDGVVILNAAFGTKGRVAEPFNLGRTTTHEVGHYLNLRHIWGDTPDCSGSDFVADTPNAEDANFGKPVFPRVSCSNGPNGDMFMNYMDYVDDDAMFLFTQGQAARMQATLEGVRRALYT